MEQKAFSGASETYAVSKRGAIRIDHVRGACQVRIMQVQDECGNDITPGLAKFLEEGSKIQMENPEEQGGIPDMIDNVCDNLEIGLRMIFNPIPSRY